MDNRQGLPEAFKMKIKETDKNGITKVVPNPLFKPENFKRGTMYFQHSVCGNFSVVAWKDNRVSFIIDFNCKMQI